MSLRGDKYETVDEIKARLEGTVVMYDNQPVYIQKVSLPDREDADEKKEIARVYFHELPLNVREDAPAGGKAIRKFLSSKKFDLTPFKMGYMNYKGNAVYVDRTPVRQYKQGLSAGTANMSDVTGMPAQGISFSHLIASPSFVDMVHNKYPRFQDVGDMIDNKTKSVAISRNFAFMIDNDLEALFLYHKSIKCGFSLRGDKALRIPPKFHFLREEMEENRIPIG